MRRLIVIGIVLGIGGMSVGWGWPWVRREVAFATAPEKRPHPTLSPRARGAERLFWVSLENAQYERLPEVLRELTAAYYENPAQPKIALSLGLAHLWRLAERERLPRPDPRITEHAVLAEKFLTEAARLAPDDGRIPGFLGSAQLAVARIHADERHKRRGYFTLRDALTRYPEFNYFAAGYALSRLPRSEPRYQEALGYMWKTFEICRGVKKEDVDAGALLATSHAGPAHGVCTNMPQAPHGLEGFVLNMGDMLVKNGEIERAQKIYAFARTSSGYAQWKHKAVLERHAATAVARAAAFAGPAAGQPAMMIESRLSCVGCHEK